MRLDPVAAIQVCRACADHGLVVARVEGGVWRHPGFESRLDCIWNGTDPPVDTEVATSNNREAAAFIERQREKHDVFIVTAPPMTGWPHKRDVV